MESNNIIARAVRSGTWASLSSTAALLLCGQRDCGSVFAPVNAVSHWLWKGRALRQNKGTLRYTVVGYVIHHAMSILWAFSYERWLARRPAPATPQHALEPPDPAGAVITRSNERPAEPAASDDVGWPTLTIVAAAVGVAAGACLVDLRCTPRRLTPGFERRLRPSSLAVVYGAFALGLALHTIKSLPGRSR